MAQLVKNLSAMQETPGWFLGQEDLLEREEATTPVFLGFPVAPLVKNLPAMWETWVWSLGWEDPLEKGKATHSSILAWRIPWVHGVAKSQTRLSYFHFLSLYYALALLHVFMSQFIEFPRPQPIPEKWASLCPLSLMGKLRLRKSKWSVQVLTADTGWSGGSVREWQGQRIKGWGRGRVIQSSPAVPFPRLWNGKALAASSCSRVLIPSHLPLHSDCVLT